MAAVAIAGVAALLPKVARSAHVQLDLVGALLASSGLVALVYGLSHAETAGWSGPVTVSSLVIAAVLLVAFGWSQTRVANPLLPVRIVLDRTRSGSYLAMLLVGSGMFAVFLFLTYYLQSTLHFSAIRTGFAFLPMVASLMVTAQITALVLARKVGPRVLIPAGMAISALGMAILAHIAVDSSYAGHVLPGLMVMGVGVGLVFATAMQSAVTGVEMRDAGVASAMVNTVQQVGGSIGIALLGTIAGNAATNYLHGKGTPTAELVQAAAVHSYTTTFWWAGAILAVGAAIVATVLEPGTIAAKHTAGAGAAEPVLVH
jgi:predicted MFS family arabinose efflux permease